MVMRILAIDPGKVTGAAVWYGSGVPDTAEIPGGIAGFTEWFNDIVPRHVPHVIAIEDWMVRPNTHKLTPEPDPYLIIGGVQMWCLTRDIPLIKIGPGEHKSFCGKGKASKVRRLGWAPVTKDGHAEDGASVLLTAMSRVDRITFQAIVKEIATHV